MREAMADCRRFGRRGRVIENAVDAVAQAQLFFERLDVNIAGAVLDGLDEHQVDELDDGAFLAAFDELVEVDFLLFVLGQFDVADVDVLEDFVDAAAGLGWKRY